MSFSEKDLRRWLNEHLDDIVSNVSNIEKFTEKLQRRLSSCHSSDYSNFRTLLHASVQAVIDQRILYGVSAFRAGSSYMSLGQEFPLIESNLPGRDPSADILAVAEQSATYAVIEVKISANAARQAITELSAYAQGLNKRYWNISSYDAIWIIISTEYRPTLEEAIAYQILMANRCIIPLMAAVTEESGNISAVDLSIHDVVKPLRTTQFDALLSIQVFDALQINFEKPIKSPTVALHYITTSFALTGSTGFCFSAPPLGEISSRVVYPYGLFVGTINPFKAFLKERELQHIGDIYSRGSARYQEAISAPVGHINDVDLATWKDFWYDDDKDDDDDKDNDEYFPDHRSLREMSTLTLNSQSLPFTPIIDQLKDMIGSNVEINCPEFAGVFFPVIFESHYRLEQIQSVRYFGILHDIMTGVAAYCAKHDPDFSGMTSSEVYESGKLLLTILTRLNSVEHNRLGILRI